MLEARGQPSPAFQPRLQEAGSLSDVTEQTDGRLVAVGDFSEVSGAVARNIVRFQRNGQVDTAFCRWSRLAGGLPARVLAQPDGTLLVGGAFAMVGSSNRPALARLLASGQPDATFAPPLLGPVGAAAGSSVREIARQPDGRILATGTLRRTGLAQAGWLRFEPSGTVDAAFQPGTLVPYRMLVQPDGRIVVGASPAGVPLSRRLPDGSADATFTSPAFTAASGQPQVTALARYPDGRLLVGGQFQQVGGVATTAVARLLPTGAADATFASTLFQPSGTATSICIQPNERILLAGAPQSLPAPRDNSLYRLLPGGQPDLAFDYSQVPVFGDRRQGTARVIVQADGAIVAAGSFDNISGLPISGLVRLLDANVLGVRSAASKVALAVWPVPAHKSLSLDWPGGQIARRVRLLDHLGQEVYGRSNQAAGLAVPVEGLAPGIYFVQVEFTTADPVVRRITVE